MPRILSLLSLLFVLTSRGATAQPPERVSYYLGEVEMTLPSGQYLGSTLSLVKRTLKPGENQIVEVVLSVDPHQPVEEYTATFSVDGARFTVKEEGGAFSGGGELTGDAWDWSGWSYTVTMGAPRSGTITAQDSFRGEDIVATKSYAGPDGKVQMLFTEKLRPISGEMCAPPRPAGREVECLPTMWGIMNQHQGPGGNAVSENESVVIELVDPLGQEATRLLHAMTLEIKAIYRDLFDNPVLPVNAPLVPGAAYLVARVNGVAVASAAFRPIEDDSTTAEVRRMYVDPPARRRGIARLLLEEVERRASAFGYRRLRLETGIRQPEATALYRSYGFYPIPPYGPHIGDPISLCFEKMLVPGETNSLPSSPLPDRARWNELWCTLGVDPPLSGDLFESVLAAYNAPDRFYHTAEHLAECLALLDDVRALCQRPEEVELALWFHDAVYDSHRSDNEEQSAQWMERVARDAGLSGEVVDRVWALILATRHSSAAATVDEGALVDIDLAILGSSPERFEKYEQGVRSEYSWVPEAEFRAERAAILQSVLGREAIYSTDFFHSRCETQARRNIERSIARLLHTPSAFH